MTSTTKRSWCYKIYSHPFTSDDHTYMNCNLLIKMYLLFLTMGADDSFHGSTHKVMKKWQKYRKVWPWT